MNPHTRIVARYARRAVVAGAILLVAGSCSDSTDPAVPCTDAVILTVGSSTAPTFSWTPTCLAYQLEVQDSTGADMWGVAADSGNTLASGLQYGVVPAQASASMAPVALVSGQFYAVGLFRLAGLSGGPELIAAKGFRP